MNTDKDSVLHEASAEASWAKRARDWRQNVMSETLPNSNGAAAPEVSSSAHGSLPGQRFRKKPVVIEAFQITEELAKRQFFYNERLPFGVMLAGGYHKERGEIHSAYTTIDTLEGKMTARLGDWIIKGVKGELYPCKPDIFAATYEPADESEENTKPSNSGQESTK